MVDLLHNEFSLSHNPQSSSTNDAFMTKRNLLAYFDASPANASPYTSAPASRPYRGRSDASEHPYRPRFDSERTGGNVITTAVSGSEATERYSRARAYTLSAGPVVDRYAGLPTGESSSARTQTLPLPGWEQSDRGSVVPPQERAQVLLALREKLRKANMEEVSIIEAQRSLDVQLAEYDVRLAFYREQVEHLRRLEEDVLKREQRIAVLESGSHGTSESDERELTKAWEDLEAEIEQHRESMRNQHIALRRRQKDIDEQRGVVEMEERQLRNWESKLEALERDLHRREVRFEDFNQRMLEHVRRELEDREAFQLEYSSVDTHAFRCD